MSVSARVGIAAAQRVGGIAQQRARLVALGRVEGVDAVDDDDASPCRARARRSSAVGSSASPSSATPDVGAHPGRPLGQQVTGDAQPAVGRREAPGEGERERACRARVAGRDQRAAGLDAEGGVLEQHDLAGRSAASARTPTPSPTTTAVVFGSGQSSSESSRSTASPSMSKWGRIAVEPARHPPRLLAEERHDGGHERHAHDERVDRDADGEAQRDRLERRVALGHERGEHGEHDDGRRGDDARRGGEARAHGAERDVARPRVECRRRARRACT